MRRSGDTLWEMWAVIFGVFLTVALPVITGILIFKIYRSFRPIEEPDTLSLASVGENADDSFFKKYLVGWLVCAPIFYFLYNFLLSE